jgi:hypothetical protein
MIDEKSSRNSSYNATLVLGVEVLDAATKQVVWQARKSGQGGNYGEAGSAVNYQETVSRALEDALAALLHDQEFSRALCHPEAAAAAPAAPAPAGS